MMYIMVGVLDFILHRIQIQKNCGSFLFRYIDMAETLCQKRALEAFRLDPAKWGGKHTKTNKIAAQ